MLGSVQTSEAVSPPYTVATVEGGQAELPCDIASGPGDRDNVYLVLWYRKDSGTPIYRYKLPLS